MKSNSNEVNYDLQHGISDKDIDATIPADVVEVVADAKASPKPKKASKQKKKSEAHEAIVPDPRVQTGEAILLLAAVSSPVSRVSIAKVLTELRIDEGQLASPLALVHHNGMLTIIPNVRHPMSVTDYDIQLTAKGKSLALFLISAEQERLSSIAKKAEEASKKLTKKSSKHPRLLSVKDLPKRELHEV